MFQKKFRVALECSFFSDVDISIESVGKKLYALEEFAKSLGLIVQGTHVSHQSTYSSTDHVSKVQHKSEGD